LIADKISDVRKNHCIELNGANTADRYTNVEVKVQREFQIRYR